MPKASNDPFGGRDDKSGAASRGMVAMEEASPYLIRTGGRAEERGCCWSFLELSGCSTSPSTAAQMITLRARPGMSILGGLSPCPGSSTVWKRDSLGQRRVGMHRGSRVARIICLFFAKQSRITSTNDDKWLFWDTMQECVDFGPTLLGP